MAPFREPVGVGGVLELEDLGDLDRELAVLDQVAEAFEADQIRLDQDACGAAVHRLGLLPEVGGEVLEALLTVAVTYSA